MRLTVEVLQAVESFYNPCGERQANLRSKKIPAIENFGALRDGFDAIDLTDNLIRILGGFPCSNRLKTLLISRNQISHIASNLSSQLPKLTTLVMAQNKIDTLSELNSLSGIPLVRLVLLDNKVTKEPNYRLYVIHLLPELKMLDFSRVTQKERDEAKSLFGSEESTSSTSGSSSSSSSSSGSDSYSTEEKGKPKRKNLSFNIGEFPAEESKKS